MVRRVLASHPTRLRQMTPALLSPVIAPPYTLKPALSLSSSPAFAPPSIQAAPLILAWDIACHLLSRTPNLPAHRFLRPWS